MNTPLTADQVQAYLARLGLPDPGSPSAAGLRRLHAAQVERIPYEVVDIHLGRPPSIDPAHSVRRILNGRGGYCYNMNGSFSALLTALGYQVRWHRGGVHMAGDAPGSESANHLALTVHGLPAPDNPGGDWLADSGLGDALHQPLPLVEGSYTQGPYTFGMSRTRDGWRFEHDPAMGSFAWMDFDCPRTATLEDFAARHEFLSTSPESGFVRTCVVALRDPEGTDVLRGCLLERRGARAAKRTIEDQAEWFAVLDEVFGLRLDSLDAADKSRLWRRVRLAHETWLASQ